MLFKGHNYFKVVTKEEYYAKLKEKYDHTCLDIVLKRLMNTFLGKIEHNYLILFL